jgi:putative transmembrane protein PGPGW
VLRHTVRVSRVAVGAVLVLVGIVLALPLVPGPGLLFIFGGLGVLGGEFEWARRLHERMHRTFRRATGRTDVE